MIVIADDITGAAEIAGIAFESGQKVQLLCADGSLCRDSVTTGCTTVIATDTRSMSEAEAIGETRRVASLLHDIPPSSLFKKTDSALRGHVVGELTALMQSTTYRRAVFLPANPSKGRIIRHGIYYLTVEKEGRKEQKPIHETDFSFDPEFPAHTSTLRERFPEAAAASIIMPDAESEADILHTVAHYDDGHTLFAGAADLFTAILKTKGRTHKVRLTSKSHATKENTLILCGSTQSRALRLGIPVAPMPLEVYDGSTDLSTWDTTAYHEQHSLILTIPHTHRTGKEAAIHLRTVMAAMAARLVAQHCPAHLIIEGGATAWATLQALGWNSFDILCQIAPGVVQMESATSGTLVTLKPGSYPWGNLFSPSANQ